MDLVKMTHDQIDGIAPQRHLLGHVRGECTILLLYTLIGYTLYIQALLYDKLHAMQL
jgi:hypothetical protein